MVVYAGLDISLPNGDLERQALLVKNRGTSLVLIINLISRLDIAVVTFVGFTLVP